MRKAYKIPDKKEDWPKSFERDSYGLRAKGCYTDTQRGLESYKETIYT